MRKFTLSGLALTLAFVAFAGGISTPTRVSNSAQQTNALMVSAIPCKLLTVICFNGSNTNQYLYVFEQTNYPPTNNEPCRIGPINVTSNTAAALSFSDYGADMDRVIVASSLTSNTFTLAGTNCTFTAITAGQGQ